MPVIEVQPLVLKDVELIIGDPTTGDDYRKHVDTVTYTPTAASITWTGLGLNTHTDVATATWVVALNHVQDWDSANSLSRYLFENEGETVVMTFRPKSGQGASFRSNVIITPGAIGGVVNTYALATINLGSDKPVLVPAA